MDPELKSILALLLDKVERIEAKMPQIDEMQASICGMQASISELQTTLPSLATKADVARLEEEQRQMKEMLGVIRLKEIGRLDGRIDQLAMDVALGRKPDAA